MKKQKSYGGESRDYIKIQIGCWYISFGKVVKTYNTFNEMIKGLKKYLFKKKK